MSEYLVSSVAIMTENIIILHPYTLLGDPRYFRMHYHVVHHVRVGNHAGLFVKTKPKA
jgi:hypothetical protein